VDNVIAAVNFISNQTGNNVKMFRSDNRTEFKNPKFLSFFTEKGIQVGFSAPYCSQSNGFVERDVQTVQEAARAMLCQSQASEKHWDDAVMAACYLLNRTLSSKNLEKPPFELVFGKKPSLHHVSVWV